MRRLLRSHAKKRSTFQPPRAAEWTTILGRRTATAPVRRDHLNAVGRQQFGVQCIAVVPAVADQPRRKIGEESRVEGGGDEVRLIR
jgi:hypothetical protein